MVGVHFRGPTPSITPLPRVVSLNHVLIPTRGNRQQPPLVVCRWERDAAASSHPLAGRPPAPRSHGSQKRTACRSSLEQAPASLAVAARRCAAAPLLAATLLLGAAACPGLPAATPAFAQSQGAALFQKACIGCHDTGGNILQPGATLSVKDLERNGVDTEEEIYNITYYGKGRMPGYGEKCTPRGQCTFGPRLPEEDIKVLAAFVKSQAENGWPKIDADVE